MKQGIHPTYYTDAKVTCASCGTTWTTGSTQKEIRVEICSNCHPFFSGESARMIDIEGQVDRFYKKLQVRQNLRGRKESPFRGEGFPQASHRGAGTGRTRHRRAGPGWHHRKLASSWRNWARARQPSFPSKDLAANR